jgi:hypothetical protein
MAVSRYRRFSVLVILRGCDFFRCVAVFFRHTLCLCHPEAAAEGSMHSCPSWKCFLSRNSYPSVILSEPDRRRRKSESKNPENAGLKRHRIVLCNSKIRLVAAAICICSLFSCQGCLDSNAKEARTIRRMSPQQRQQVLASLAPAQQVDIYISGATKFEPPILLPEVAANWRAVLPIVKERLLAENGQAARFQLLWLLVTINENYCSLVERQDILSAASQSVVAMKSYKHVAQEPLERLTTYSNPTNLPPCNLPPCK